MSLQSWQEALITAQVDGGALTNTSATPTSLLPPAAKFTLPANYFYIGKMLRITACFRVSNVVTTPGTLTLDIRFGSTVVFNGGAMQMSTTAHTNLPLWWDVLLTCRAIGNSTNSNLMGQSKAHSQVLNISGADSTQTHSTLLAPNAAPAVGTGFDSTATQAVDLFGTFSVSTATTSITLHQFLLEALN